MLLYLDDCFAEHETRQHPECPQRITKLNAILRSEVADRATCPQWEAAQPKELTSVHDAAYAEQLENWCAADAGRIEADTVVSRGSWRAATMAAGAAVDATRRVVAGEDQTAFCGVRPPGHHAIPTGPMGFCLLNNIAIAARTAIASGLRSVLIVDFDVHHGNGTQDAFYEDEQVGFFSIHRSPFYPGTGSASETGTSAGLGTTLNVPVAADTSLRQFLDALERGITTLADRIHPELILVSAGFDAHRLDPVGGLCLEDHDYVAVTQIIQQAAAAYCNGRIVSLLEGGYHLDHMPQSALTHVKELMNAPKNNE